jgi:hypothetical protein
MWGKYISVKGFVKGFYEWSSVVFGSKKIKNLKDSESKIIGLLSSDVFPGQSTQKNP